MNERDRSTSENILTTLTKAGVAVAVLGWLGNVANLVSLGLALATGSFTLNEITRHRQGAH